MPPPTQTTGAMQDTSNPLASLAAINTFVGMLKGSTSSQTQQSNITPEGMNYLLTQILSGSQGLAPIAQGEKTAGLYNSTGRSQMLNDLSVRTAGELAAKQAGTTTTNRQNPSVSLFPILAAFAGTKLLGPTVKTGMQKLGIPSIDQAGTAISDAIWGAGSTAGSPATLAAADTAAGLNPLYGSIAAYEGAIAGGSTAAASGAVSEDALASYYGADVATGAEVAGSAAAGAELAGTTAAVDTAITAEAAMTAAETAAVASEGAGIGEAIATAAAAWVICTELQATGKLAPELYSEGAKHISSIPDATIRGYHWWAVPYTRLMRKNSFFGMLARKWITPWAIGRTKYLAGKWNLLGWLTVIVGEPICHLIGLVVPSQNWQVLYE